MYIESKILEKIKSKENFTSINEWDTEVILLISGYVLWIILWIATIINSIILAKNKKAKRPEVGLIIAVLSWPFYWLFKFTKVIG